MLHIDSIPTGAEIKIDGEYAGTAPFDVTIIDPIDDFRDECLSNGEVVCGWNILEARLNDHTVSTLWWELTEKERRSISKTTIENTINKVIRYYRKGIDGEWKTLASPCTYNSIIRFQKFGTPIGWDDCYWKYSLTSPDVFCYVPEHHFGLPCVHVNTYDHVMCGIQVVPSIESLDNWIVFQYSSIDIKPGHFQMPTGKHVLIQDPFPYAAPLFNCIGFDSNIITDFYI